jgi:hypothetical protein
MMALLGAGLPGLASGLQHGTDRCCSVAYYRSAAYSINRCHRGDMCDRILESESMNNVESESMNNVRRFFQQMERWLVSLVMAAMAYAIEKALLRSIRRREAKPLSHESSA